MEAEFGGLNGEVRVEIDEAAKTMTVITVPGHPFHDGRVVHDVIVVGGEVLIRSTGTGTGPLRDLNQERGPAAMRYGVQYQVKSDMGF